MLLDFVRGSAFVLGLCLLKVSVTGASANEAKSPASIKLYADVLPLEQPDMVQVIVTAYNLDATTRTLTPQVVYTGTDVSTQQTPGPLQVGPWACDSFGLQVPRRNGQFPTGVVIGFKEAHAQLELPLAPSLDLTKLRWERKPGDASADAAPDSGWEPQTIPGSFATSGTVLLQCRFALEGAPPAGLCRIFTGPIEDADEMSINGHVIGTGEGWDQPRSYALPGNVLRSGENTLQIKVRELYAPPRGSVRGPIVVVFGTAVTTESLGLRPCEVDIRDPRPAPKQSERTVSQVDANSKWPNLYVKDGLLFDRTGREACLYGTNYCPANWMDTTTSLAKAGVTDLHASITRDLEDLKLAGCEVIRLTMFEGNFVRLDGSFDENDNIDSMDWMLAECDRLGLPVMFTPFSLIIGQSVPGKGGHYYVKNAFCLTPELWRAQVRYLDQLLNRKNRYTRRRIADEPCIALLEIINEPHCYYDFNQVENHDIADHGPALPETARENLVPLIELWQAYQKRIGIGGRQVFAHFRYTRVMAYINTMTQVFRQAGMKQPVLFHGDGDIDVQQAIADSRIDGVTFWAYPGSLVHETDQENLIGSVGPWSVPRAYRAKGRVIYEFDAAGQVRSSYLFPLIARQARSRGAQVACQFQYDPFATVPWNTAWPQHYLNLWHTPHRAADWLIGREVFHALPRGVVSDVSGDSVVAPPLASSFKENVSLFSTIECYGQSRATAWRPIETVNDPARIITVGNGPFIDYDGTGLVLAHRHGDAYEIRIMPDVDVLKPDQAASPVAPLTQLSSREHTLRWKMAGWEHARIERASADQPKSVKSGEGGGWRVVPGIYRISR